MVDAYEVGIRLALQDDVSAGLAIIHRELADVDRAIAATSAGLVQLIREAQASSKAVAGIARVVSRPAPSEDLAAAPAQAEQVPAKATERPVVEEPRSTAAAGPSAPSERTVAAQTSVAPAVETPSSSESSAAPVSAPHRANVSDVPSLVINQHFSAAQEPGPTAAIAKTAMSPVRSAVQPQRRIDALRADPVQSPAAAAPVLSDAPKPNGSLIASIGTAFPSLQRVTEQNISGTADRLGLQPSPATEPHSAAAPWFRNDIRPAVQRQSMQQDRAIAPQPTSRDQTEGSGGVVMLDGRLVGHWLSEQMARDASRPPSGTSFFDPRQSPAWTASGAV